MKIKLHGHKGISLERMLMNIALFCVSTFALLEHASVSIPMTSMIKTPLMLLGGLCIAFRFFYFTKRLKKKKNFYVFLYVGLFCIALLAAAYLNSSPKLGDPPMKDTVRLILYLIEMYLVMLWASDTGNSKFVLDFLFYYVLILTIATDALLFTRIITFSDGRFENYLIGTKFSVSYSHMNLLTLWYVRNRTRFRSDKKAKRILFWGIPYVFIVAIRVDCMSGVLGCAVLMVLFALMDTPFQRQLLRLNSPGVLGTAISLSVAFPFAAESILSIPAVAYVVQDLFNRDSRLTGRLNIFEKFGSEMDGHWLLGYGYGNGNVVATRLFGYANAQNAVLQWVLQVGIPASVCLILVFLIIFRQMSRSKEMVRSMPFAVLIYMYIILGTIETTFSMSFLLWFGVIYMLVNERKNVSPSGKALPVQP